MVRRQFSGLREGQDAPFGTDSIGAAADQVQEIFAVAWSGRRLVGSVVCPHIEELARAEGWNQGIDRSSKQIESVKLWSNRPSLRFSRNFIEATSLSMKKRLPLGRGGVASSAPSISAARYPYRCKFARHQRESPFRKACLRHFTCPSKGEDFGYEIQRGAFDRGADARRGKFQKRGTR